MTQHTHLPKPAGLSRGTAYRSLLIISLVLGGLSGCASRPVVPAVYTTSVPEFYTVQPGDSLSVIAARYGLHYPDIAALNQMQVTDHILVGQQLRLRAHVSSQMNPPAAVTATAPPVYRTPDITLPTYAGGAATSALQWQMPSSNALIGRFDPANNRKGWYFSGKVGDPVRAAAAGNVIYVGSGVRDYGQLILLQHEGGIISAYAHNSRMRVKSGDQVSAGQVIAEMGQDDTGRTVLQFQVRQDGRAIDPAQLFNQK